jgi:hypothetical protein
MAISTGKTLHLQILLTVLLTFSTAVSGYLATSILNNKNRIITIEADQFTVADSRAIWVEFALVRAEMGTLREDVARLPLDTPPEWFIKRIDRIETRLDRMEGYFKGGSG